MELNKIEVQILLDLYERDFEYKKINISINNYDFNEKTHDGKVHEFASYLLKLKRICYIDFQDNVVLIPGGHLDRKYKNNIRAITYTENIYLKDKGIKFVENAKKTIADKIKEKGANELKSLGIQVYKEIKDWGTKTIAEVFIKSTKG